MDTIKKATMLIHNTILKILFLTSIIGVLFDCIKSPRLNIIRYLIVSQNQSIKKIDFLSLYPTFMRVCEELIFLKLDAVFRIQFVHKYVTRKKCDKLFVTFFLRFLGNEKSELVAFSEGAISRQPLKI